MLRWLFGAPTMTVSLTVERSKDGEVDIEARVSGHSSENVIEAVNLLIDRVKRELVNAESKSAEAALEKRRMQARKGVTNE